MGLQGIILYQVETIGSIPRAAKGLQCRVVELAYGFPNLCNDVRAAPRYCRVFRHISPQGEGEERNSGIGGRVELIKVPISAKECRVRDANYITSLRVPNRSNSTMASRAHSLPQNVMLASDIMLPT